MAEWAKISEALYTASQSMVMDSCTPEEAAVVLAERAKAGIIPREPRKGFYRMYTENARSAMQGGGLE